MFAPTIDRAIHLDRPAADGPVEKATKYLSQTFDQRLNTLRQVERALSRVGRHIAYSQSDPPLQAFWCGVKRDLEQEAHRLALGVGEVAVRLSPVDS